MSKQDRQGARTPADIERKYNFGQTFGEIIGLANAAQKTADDAKAEAGKATEKLTPDEIFNLLTENGTLQGLYRGDDGELYINASYIKTGELLADLIKSGKITSQDGKVIIDLSGASGFTTNGLAVKANASDTVNLFRVGVMTIDDGTGYFTMFATSADGKTIMRMNEDTTAGGVIFDLLSKDGDSSASVVVNNNGASVLIQKGAKSAMLSFDEQGNSELTVDKINGMQVEWVYDSNLGRFVLCAK